VHKKILIIPCQSKKIVKKIQGVPIHIQRENETMNGKIFVLQFTGDLHSKADQVTLLTFDNDKSAQDHIDAKTYAYYGKFCVFKKIAVGSTVDIPDVTINSGGAIIVY
jgi:hypothetical protein